MKAKILSIAVISFAMVCSSPAIDNDAKFIDSIGVYGLSYHDGHLANYGIWGETPVFKMAKDWSIIAGLGYGIDSPDNGGDLDIWDGMLGVKKYITDLTSVSLAATYMDYDVSYDYNIFGANLSGKHRFTDISDGISPFLTAGIAYRAINASRDTEEVVLSVGAGCEFLITKDLSLVFEAAYVRGDSLSNGGPEIRNGVMGAIYFTGYWD